MLQVLIRQMPGGIRMVLIAIGNSGPYKVFYRATGENVDKALPQCVITLSAPHKTTLFLGFQKKYSKIALRLDDPVYFRNYLNSVSNMREVSTIVRKIR